MKFKKVLIPALFSLCLFSLTSCDILEFIKDNTDIDTDGIADLINGDPTEETYEPVDIDETNLDYGYLDLQKYSNKEQLIGLYTEIDGILGEFMTSSKNLTATPREISGETKNYYIIKDEVSFSKYGLSYEQASSVYKCVLLDNPEYYFPSNTLLNASITIGNTTKKYLALCCDEDYILGSVRANYNQQLTTYDSTIKGLIASTTNPIQKTKIIHDYIINNGQYAFKPDGVTPDDSSMAHNLLGLVVNHKGVCESYAELFHYLLKNNGICSIMVTGDAYTSMPAIGEGEAHAWNYVKFNFDVEGEVVPKWFGFDVTWDDPANLTVCNHTYFGQNSVKESPHTYYPFTSSHVPDSNGNMNRGLNYLYALPTLSDTSINLEELD